jgi:hypothetical protein
MSRSRIVATSVAVSVLLIAANAVAGVVAKETAQLPDIQAPPGGSAAWIAQSMRLNGVPMTIKRLTSPSNAQTTLHYYESDLRKSSDLKMRRSQEGQWQMLAVMHDRYYATIRLHDAGVGAIGTITVTPALSQARPSKRTRFPHPASSRVVSLQQYEDRGIEAEHINLVSSRSVTIAAREFAAELSKQGWEVLRNEPTARRRDGYVIEAQKAASLAQINLRRAENGPATAILVVWRKA